MRWMSILDMGNILRAMKPRTDGETPGIERNASANSTCKNRTKQTVTKPPLGLGNQTWKSQTERDPPPAAIHIFTKYHERVILQPGHHELVK